MIQSEISTDIAKPLPEVFDFLGDVSHAPSWIGMCEELKVTSPGRLEAGSALLYTYRQGGKLGQMQGRVTEYRPGSALGLSFSDDAFDVELSLTLSGKGPGATSVTRAQRIQPKTFWARLFSPLIRFSLGRQLAEDASRLRKKLEGNA